MSYSFDLRLEREIDGYAVCAVEGYDLARGKTLTRLDELARSLEVHPLSAFLSDGGLLRSEEAFLASITGYGGDDTDDDPGHWYEASDALASITALLQHLSANPKLLRGAKGPREELGAFSSALQVAAKEGVRFQFHCAL